MTARGEFYIEAVSTEFDREDILMSPVMMNAKRISEYIINQEPYVSELTALTGYLRFDGAKLGDVPGDIFGRPGHENFAKMMRHYYNKPVNGLCTFEWQHSVADFNKVIRIGIKGIKAEIESVKENCTDPEKLEFLNAVSKVADAIIGWAHKCSAAALAKSHEVSDPEAKKNLERLSSVLLNVPENPADSFLEAVQTVYIIYAFVPDSIGCIDRYLRPFYRRDIAAGKLIEEEARAYLQELFLMLQARISIKSDRFYRGGECHFAVGGYLPNGEDGFDDFSKLIVDSVLELPTWIPQISLRWTKKTPRDVLRYMMDRERRDPHKRIAFVNDEPRIKAFCEVAGFPFELACEYTMVGCNEPQLPGGIFMGGCDCNVAMSLENTLHKRRDDICKAESFDDFFSIYKEELHRTLGTMLEYYNKFQAVRARDVNLVSTMFFEGSIKRAKSITQGGAENAMACIQLMGIVTTIDSLSVIRQYVYDEKKVTMETLLDAIDSDWNGYDTLHLDIKKNAHFFGNNDEVSNGCAKCFAEAVSEYLAPRRSDMGYRYFTGNLIGYNQHHKWFGEYISATPDGRHSGDAVSYGISQNFGRDREGITALLASIAKMNENTVFCGSTVTNVMMDEQTVKKDELFERAVDLFETYFRLGGLHFQPNYVSAEDLRAAKAEPDKYRSLRVRVSGFSDYFRLLNGDLQDEIITRTELSV